MAAKKKKTTTKPYGNKTKFVLGLARDLSAKEVVEEAKKNGITITEAHVYKIRSTAKAKGKGPAKAERGASRGRGAAKATRGSSGGGQSKRDFVLSFGAETPASEILRKAKEAGIGLSKAYLYTIRSSGGASQRRGGRAAAAVTSIDKSALRRVGRGSSSLETQFIDAAVDLGLSRATELLDRLRSRIKGF
jgi:type III secretion system FlhB-like substrate exporter